MLKKPFDVVSKYTRNALTEGKAYTVLRISMRGSSVYYQVIGDEGKKVRHHAKSFLKISDLEERGV